MEVCVWLNSSKFVQEPRAKSGFSYFIAIFLIMAITSLRSLSFKLAE